MAADDVPAPHRRQHHRDGLFEGRAQDRPERPGRVHGVPRLPGRGMGGVVHQPGRAGRRRSSATSWPWTARSAAPRRCCSTATATSTARKATRPRRRPLRAGDALAFRPERRPSLRRRLPLLPRSCSRTGGLSLAIGWPAQWAATFQRAGRRRARPGRPGEDPPAAACRARRIRTPRMTVLSWTGDASRAVNLWRRWYLAHILPRPNGQPLQPLLACARHRRGRGVHRRHRGEPGPLHRAVRASAASASTSGGSTPAGIPATTRTRERKWWHHRHLGA